MRKFIIAVLVVILVILSIHYTIFSGDNCRTYEFYVINNMTTTSSDKDIPDEVTFTVNTQSDETHSKLYNLLVKLPDISSNLFGDWLFWEITLTKDSVPSKEKHKKKKAKRKKIKNKKS